MKKKFLIQGIETKRAEGAERRYLLFPNDNAVTSSLYSNTLYEPYLYEFLKVNNVTIQGTTVVDVGGNNGQIAVEFAHLVGDSGRVFSFEPQRIIFQQLCSNVFINGLDNVWAYNIALGDKEGYTTIETPDYFSQGPVNFGNTHVDLAGTPSSEKVAVVKLDSLGLQNVSIIKIDVQGYERKVLLGAKETIKKNRPIIYIEIEEDQLALYGDTQDDVFETLKQMDYSFSRFNDGIPYYTNSGLCLDFVALPNEMSSQKEWQTIFR